METHTPDSATSAASPQAPAQAPSQAPSLEHLIIQAELGQDEIVRTGVAALHPADTAELLNVLEEPEVKHKVFGFLAVPQAAEVLSLVSAHTKDALVERLSDDGLGDLVEYLDSDDATDLLASLSARRARGCSRRGAAGPVRRSSATLALSRRYGRRDHAGRIYGGVPRHAYRPGH